MFVVLLLVYEFNEPVVLSIDANLLFALDVNVFKLPVVLSIVFKRVLLLLV